MVAVIAVLFVAVNVYSSQLFPSLLFQVIELRHPEAVKQFLANIEDEPEFNQQYAYFNGLYDNAFAEEDLQQAYSLSSELDRFEAQLERNEKNPNILVKIAFLHLDRGDSVSARKYYQRAKEIDPWIEVEELAQL